MPSADQTLLRNLSSLGFSVLDRRPKKGLKLDGPSDNLDEAMNLISVNALYDMPWLKQRIVMWTIIWLSTKVRP